MRYLVRSSLPAREARNLQRFHDLGIPTAHVLAVGDVRHNFLLKQSYLVTEFLPDTADGRIFMPGGNLAQDMERRLTFTRMHLALLAKIHEHCFFHKAFHPRNLLWRERDGRMEVFWIDVARCRRVRPFRMKRAMIMDLHTYFRDMLFPRETVRTLLGEYLTMRSPGSFRGNAQDLLEELIHFKRHLFALRRKRYQLFGE